MANKKKSTLGFFFKLAWQNLLRNKQTYIPYLIAAGIMSGVYLLICGLSRTDTLTNLPSGEIASSVFLMGTIAFSVFTVFFMVYINNFLISQRKREFGLYGVLGLEKRHVSTILLIENAMVLVGGLIIGLIIALVFGQMIFWILLKVINSVPGSRFTLDPKAYTATFSLFAFIFVVTSLLDIRQVRLSNPIELMTSKNRGEKERRASKLGAILGIAALLGTYYLAWTIDNSGAALLLFFPLVVLVIFSTFSLSSSGSIMILESLKKNRGYYYKPRHFISLSGLIQRMRQNARGLASICILSSMLIVSVSGTLALYLGREEMLRNIHPFDVDFYPMVRDMTDEEIVEFEGVMLDLAEKYDVELVGDSSKVVTVKPEDKDYYVRSNYMPEGARWVELSTVLYYDDGYHFDVKGDLYDCEEFCDELGSAYNEYSRGFEEYGYSIHEIFGGRIDGYGLYGGLLFLGVFFGLLFLAVTVLIIYFKQITEGYEDRERFIMLQKVGMDDSMVKKAINSQVIWVFFIPLAITVLHMVFASRIITTMMRVFSLYDYWLILGCIGAVLAIFILMYFLVYKLTARVYYKIVKW